MLGRKDSASAKPRDTKNTATRTCAQTQGSLGHERQASVVQKQSGYYPGPRRETKVRRKHRKSEKPATDHATSETLDTYRLPCLMFVILRTAGFRDFSCREGVLTHRQQRDTLQLTTRHVSTSARNHAHRELTPNFS